MAERPRPPDTHEDKPKERHERGEQGGRRPEGVYEEDDKYPPDKIDKYAPGEREKKREGED